MTYNNNRKRYREGCSDTGMVIVGAVAFAVALGAMFYVMSHRDDQLALNDPPATTTDTLTPRTVPVPPKPPVRTQPTATALEPTP